MKENNLTVQQAMDHVGKIYVGIRDDFLYNYNNLPVYEEPLNSLVQEYCWCIGHFVTATIKWSLKSERYFVKSDGLEMMRKVTLRPSFA
jgi:Delta6-protoilludene synthase